MFGQIAKTRNSQPPLGILYLAAVARKRGHSVRLIDADVEDHTSQTLRDELLKGSYDLVGLTATSPIFHKAVHLARALKQARMTAPILIGGEHVNIFRKEAFEDCFDYGFFGESDRTFDRFLELLERGAPDVSGMRGVIYRHQGDVVETEPAERITDLDSLEFPAMELLRHDRYTMTFARHRSRRYLPIMATRGCPFKCAFCSEPLTNPNVRFRGAASVVDEMEKWSRELGISHFFFMDSNLTLKRDQVEGFCKELLRRKLGVTFEGWTRANLVDREILELLHSAGLIRMSYGIESGDPEVLKIIRKEVSLDDMRRAFALTEEVGIEPACSVMLGLPGDTRASVERTIRFVASIPQILYSNFSIANPYPGTEMYRWAVEGKHGVKMHIKDFSDYRRYDGSPVSVNDLSAEDLVTLQKVGLLRIHLTPRRMWAAARMLGLWQLVPLVLTMILTAFRSLFTGRR